MDYKEAKKLVYAGKKVKRTIWPANVYMALSPVGRPYVFEADGKGISDPFSIVVDPDSIDWEELK